MGFIKTLKITNGGHVVEVGCETCEVPGISGYTGTLSLLWDVEVLFCIVEASEGSQCSVGLSLFHNELEFQDGLLINVT